MVCGITLPILLGLIQFPVAIYYLWKEYISISRIQVLLKAERGNSESEAGIRFGIVLVPPHPEVCLLTILYLSIMIGID